MARAGAGSRGKPLGGYRVPKDVTVDAFPKVVFMRKRVIKIYQVPLSLLNIYSLSTLLFSLFLTGAATLWTGYETLWNHPGVLACAWMVTGFAILSFIAAAWSNISMRIGLEKVPYPTGDD